MSHVADLVAEHLSPGKVELHGIDLPPGVDTVSITEEAIVTDREGKTRNLFLEGKAAIRFVSYTSSLILIDVIEDDARYIESAQDLVDRYWESAQSIDME